MRDQSRRGMTIAQLLVIIAILGVLMAFLPLSIQRGHVNSRRMQCANNIRQIGLGLNGYLNTHDRFPNAGTFREADGVTDVKDSVINNLFHIGRPGGDFAKAKPLRNWVVDILPYIDQTDMANVWNSDVPYDDVAHPSAEGPTNRAIASKSMNIVSCPDDPTVHPGQGHLSYVVNGGFTRWHAVPYTWEEAGAGAVNGPPLNWIAPPMPSGTPQWAVTTKTGVMFLGTHTGQYPWDARTTPRSITDGASQTILASENLHAGASKGSPYADGADTNWACPHPNFMMFVGSDRIAQPGKAYDCADGTLALRSDGTTEGRGWAEANRPGTFGSINAPMKSQVPGSSIAPSSGHKGGVNVLFCDGTVRFIKESIDGTVWSKLLTPAGTALPTSSRQGRLSEADFGPL